MITLTESCLYSLSLQSYLGTVLSPARNFYLFCPPYRLYLFLTSQSRLRYSHPFCTNYVLSFLSEFWMFSDNEFQVQIPTRSIFALITFAIKRHRPVILDTTRNSDVFLNFLDKYSCSFTISAWIFYDQSDTLASHTFQMHHN